MIIGSLQGSSQCEHTPVPEKMVLPSGQSPSQQKTDVPISEKKEQSFVGKTSVTKAEQWYKNKEVLIRMILRFESCILQC